MCICTYIILYGHKIRENIKAINIVWLWMDEGESN